MKKKLKWLEGSKIGKKKKFKRSEFTNGNRE